MLAAGEDPGQIPQEPTNNHLYLLPTVIFNSFKVLLNTKKLSFYIFTFLSFPLSFLLFLSFFLTSPLQTKVQHLEALSIFSPIHVESEHVMEEANREAKSLLLLKALFFLPTFLLSSFTAVAAVTTASTGKPTVSTVFTAVKTSWKRLWATAMCVYATMLACTVVPGTVMVVFYSHPFIRAAVAVLGSGFELHLMAVTSLALVVSINEGSYGFDAIWVGASLMEGKRVCGWVLSGLFVLFSGSVRGTLEMSIHGLEMDWVGIESTVVIKLLWDCAVWIGLYAWVVQWSFIVTTVFYFDLKKRGPTKIDSEISLV